MMLCHKSIYTCQRKLLKTRKGLNEQLMSKIGGVYVAPTKQNHLYKSSTDFQDGKLERLKLPTVNILK